MELLIALGLASWLGYRWWSSSKTAAATKQDSFTRAQYEAAVRDLVKQPDFVAVLSSGGAVPDMVLTLEGPAMGVDGVEVREGLERLLERGVRRHLPAARDDLELDALELLAHRTPPGSFLS